MASKYVFLPWLRRGLANKIVETDPLTDAPASAPNASVKVGVKVMADDKAQQTVQHDVVLLGPGDISGMERNAVVKTEPRRGVANFEPNYFPYIEFYEEDFPWRYTPAKAANDLRLRPWLALVVLEESEFERKKISSGNNNQVVFIRGGAQSTVFPPADQTWAWAHVQINDEALDLSDGTKRDSRIGESLTKNANLGSSRLLCPRRLHPNTHYYAFLIPAFEKGRVAGLGGQKDKIDAAGRFEPAWGNEQTFQAGHYPVFYEWDFRTGDADIEALAEKIKPQDLSGLDVGKLWMNCQDIGYGDKLDYKGNLDPANPGRRGFLPFEGALRMVGPDMPNLVQRNGAEEKTMAKNLSDLLNLSTLYRLTEPDKLGDLTKNILWAENDDPLLVPPIYGRWHIQPDGNPKIKPEQSGNWLEQLNLDPAMRAAAGLGAEVVRQHQEDFVGRAWQQFSSARKSLNQALLGLRFAQEVTKTTVLKHFSNVSDADASRQLGLTAGLHTAISSPESGKSLAGILSGYKGETSFVNPNYRRLTRTRGPVMKRVKGSNWYNKVLMGGTQFEVVLMVFVATPPFQNFDSKLIGAINPEKIKVPGAPGADFSLKRPNWFGSIIKTVSLPGTREAFKTAFLKVQTITKKPKTVSPPAPDLKKWSALVKAKIDPERSFRNKYAALLPAGTTTKVNEATVIAPNTFNPSFTEPTYEYLTRLNPGLFIPNLEKINPNSTVLLQANQAFIEAYLAGLNHEMAAELLWRGFPVNMNATFFSRFWNTAESGRADTNDILPMKDWKPASGLGKNKPTGVVANPLVLVIRAELVKKYQNLVIYAHRAKKDGTARKPDAPDNNSIKSPLFVAQMEPDFLFAGFDLSSAQVTGAGQSKDKDGWYFVLAERPGEMHFGMDIDGLQGAAGWNELNWAELPSNVDMLDLETDNPVNTARKNTAGKILHWGKGQGAVAGNPASGNGDAAQMAAILQQRPVRIFFHASMLLPKT